MAGDVNVMRTLGAESTEEGNHEYHIQYTSYTAGSWRASVRLCGHDLAATATLLVTIRALDPTAACSRFASPSRSYCTSHRGMFNGRGKRRRQAGPMRSRVTCVTCVPTSSLHANMDVCPRPLPHRRGASTRLWRASLRASMTESE
jgi:hypothetical protein